MGSYALKRLQAWDAGRKAKEKADTPADSRLNMQYMRELAEAEKMTGDIPSTQEIWDAHRQTVSQWRSDAQEQEIQRRKEEAAHGDAVVPSTSQIRADEANRRLERLQAAHDQKIKARAAKQKEDQFYSDLVTGDPNAVVPMDPPDEEENRLRRQMEQAEMEAKYWENQRTMERDAERLKEGLAIIEGMPEDERAVFEDYARRSTVSPEDIDTWLRFKDKYGDRLEYLLEARERDLNQKRVQEISGKAVSRTQTTMGKILQAPVAVVANVVGGAAGTANRIDEMVNGTGGFERLAPNVLGDIPSIYAQEVTKETVDAILNGEQMRFDDGISGRELGALAYQGVMAAAETGGRLLASGGNPGIAAALAASQSWNSSIRDATAKGATPGQAYAFATVNAGIEAATEKLPLDELIKTAKGGVKKAAATVWNILKQAGIEATEEEVSLIGTTLAEAAILQEKSGYNQQVTEAVLGGATYEEARDMANHALLAEAINTGITSAISGTLSAGGAEHYAARNGNNDADAQSFRKETKTEEQRKPAEHQQEQETPEQPTQQETVGNQEQKTHEQTQRPGPEQEAAEQPRQTEVEQLLEGISQDQEAAEQPRQTEVEQLLKGISQEQGAAEQPRQSAPAAEQTAKSAEDQQGGGTEEPVNATKGSQRAVGRFAFNYLRVAPQNSYLSNDGNGDYTMYDDGTVEPGDKIIGGLNEMNGWRDSGLFALFNPVVDGKVVSTDSNLPGGYFTAVEVVKRPVVKQVASTYKVVEKGEIIMSREGAGKPSGMPVGKSSGADTPNDQSASFRTDSAGAAEEPDRIQVEAVQQPNPEQAQMDAPLEGIQQKQEEQKPAENTDWMRQTFESQQEQKAVPTDTKAVSNPIDSYPAEKQKSIRSYLQSVDDTIKNFVQRVKSGDKTFTRQKITDVSDRAAEDIGALLGIDASGYTHNINTGGVQHIINRHGSNGEHDNSMALDDDIARVGWVLENYDSVELLTENGKQVYSKEFKDSNNNPAPQIRFIKKIDGSYYVVEAACENKYKKLWVQSAYLQNNNGDVTQVSADGPSANHETNARSELASPSPIPSLPKNGAKVNGNIDESSTQDADIQEQSPEGGQNVSASESDYRNSNTYMNTGVKSRNDNIRVGYRQELRKNPEAARYAVKHNADTLVEAQSRTGNDGKNAEALYDLLNRDHWTAEDVATSTLLMDQIMASGDDEAIAKLNDLRQKRKAEGSRMGQEVQAFRIQNPTMKDASSPATAVDTFQKQLDGMKQEETTYNKKSGVDFETWKQNIQDEVDQLGIAIAMVEDGDEDSMRQIIRQIAGRRKTTAWFGISKNLTGRAWGILKKLGFEDLKKIANTQLVAMADDYRARSAGEIVKTVRKEAMLSSLKTFARNIGGNAAGGFADAVSESGAGRLADTLLSKFTGKKTMGNDLFRGATYVKAAKEAAQFASLCVELNIPIETDVESSYAAAAGKGVNEKYIGRTFRATGNPAMRAMYAYQKYMSYALEVTDKLFEGGSNAAVAESLNRLQDANLSQEDVEKLAAFAANKRTFKNATWEEEGNIRGSTLARKGAKLQENAGIFGEVAAPFVPTPMNVAQTGIDYTAGVAKGLGEMVSIIKDAKAGKTIPVERQRQAASDFGRGVTGTAMIALFASAAAMGALKVSNGEDWDKEALAQAEGRSGVQINWSSLLRGLNGDDASWKTGDIISGADFLEPFNTQMYLGAELANAEDMNLLTYAGATIKSVWQSLMDSPVMTGLSEIEETLKDISEAETIDDAVNVAAGYIGDTASSFVPQFVRQTAQNMDGYYRDTRGETAWESAVNSLMAAIPGQSQKLPVKYSGLGEAQKRGNWAETFLDPTATKAYQENEITTFLDELSDQTGETSFYPDRQAPMRITVNKREIALDGEMRTTYQKTYGEKYSEITGALMANQDFAKLSAEQQIEALDAVKTYSTEFAKAAVSEYKEVQRGTASQIASRIISSEVVSDIDSAFTDIATAREYGYDQEPSNGDMKWAYDTFMSLSPEAKEDVRDQATGTTAKYIEAREKGVSHTEFISAAESIAKAKGTGSISRETGKPSVRDVDKREAIANTRGLSEESIDTIMKCYMEDYDPENGQTDTTELKYDYIRQELGLSPKEYAETYRAYVDNDKKDDQVSAIRELGYDEETANLLRDVYYGTKKAKAAYMSLYED